MAEIKDHEFMPIVPFMPTNPQYGNAYVPYQMDFDIVEPREAMEMGTVFPSLFSQYEEGESLW